MKVLMKLTIMFIVACSIGYSQDVFVRIISKINDKYEFQCVNNSDLEVGGFSIGRTNESHNNIGIFMLKNVNEVIGPPKWECDKFNDTEGHDCYLDYSMGDGKSIAPHDSMRGFFVVTSDLIMQMKEIPVIITCFSRKDEKVIEIKNFIVKSLHSSFIRQDKHNNLK
ncbi:hypothetical protein GALL_520350 [mine drainage metagenome]|uniref:Uncharacterized protein n=1 Tax=mine drainage metagenome TaxID=410659 RepID=A0A1J5P5D4_9ZZZZ